MTGECAQNGLIHYPGDQTVCSGAAADRSQISVCVKHSLDPT